MKQLRELNEKYNKRSDEFKQACESFRQLEKQLESNKTNMTPEEYESKLNDFKTDKENANKKFEGFGYIS